MTPYPVEAVERIGKFIKNFRDMGPDTLISSIQSSNREREARLSRADLAALLEYVEGMNSEKFEDAIWQAIKNQCASDPQNAKRITMMSAADFSTAFFHAKAAISKR